MKTRPRDGRRTTFHADRDNLPARGVIAAAAVLFALILLAHSQVSSTGPEVALLYTLPIALLALRFGMRGGFTGAAIASVLFIAAGLFIAKSNLDVDDTALILTYWLLGGLVGWLGGMLAANEQRFEIALRNAPILVFNMDRELRYTWYRQTWHGGVDSPLIGRTDLELLAPAEAEVVNEIKRRVIESGEHVNEEVSLRGPDGRPRWYAIAAEPVTDSRGRVTGLTGAALDITEAKQAVAALAESEQRFRNAVENLLEPFALCSAIRDADGRIIDFRVEYVDSAAAESIGMERMAMYGQTLSAVFPGRLESGLIGEYAKVVETGEPFFNEAVDFINVLGEEMLVRAFDMRVSKLDDGVEIVWRDITDRVRAERDRDWLAAIVESSVDAIIGSRPDGTIESWRAGAKRLYGYDAEEVIGKQYSVLFPEEVAELREQRFQQVLTGKTVGPIEATETRKDGSAVRVSYTASPIKGDSGEVIGVARIVREVSDLIAADRTTVADIADYAPRRRRPASN